MKDTFMQTMKDQLLAEKTRLENELSKFAHRNPNSADTDFKTDFPNHGDKEDENAAEVAMFEKNLSMEKTLEISLFNVNKALKKIDEGNYGICEKCERPINPERLNAFPSATACMKCKEKSL